MALRRSSESRRGRDIGLKGSYLALSKCTLSFGMQGEPGVRPGRSDERLVSLSPGLALAGWSASSGGFMDRPATGPSLLDHFAALEDPRQRAKALYPLPEILLLLLCATLAGADDVTEVGIWGGEN